jgi:signal transduction histidine kinase
VVRMGGWVDTVGVDARPVPVVADRHRLERVLSNLVSNAVTHGGRGVTVSVSAEDGDAVVEVADAGPGIAAGELPNLFRRFYKVRSAPAGSGSGLGLAIAAENARLLGGTLAVDSEEGQGARFTLRLPADRGREPGSTEAVAQP